MRIFLYLILAHVCGFVFSQALPPEGHGGDKNKTLNLRINTNPTYDFIKFNPDYQPTPPTKRICASVEIEEKRKAFMRGAIQQSI